jgi:hypothetical protein
MVPSAASIIAVSPEKKKINGKSKGGRGKLN